MASLEEFVSDVQASIESLKQAQSSMDAPKQQAEELSSQFQGLGAESMATGSQGLKEGVEQTQGMVPPIITQLEQIIASAQGMKSGLRAATPDVRPPPTPLDAAPPALREPVAQVGDPVTAPEEVSVDDDKRVGRLGRLGRTAVRNAGDLKSQGEDLAKSANSTIGFFNPPSGTTATSAVPEPLTQIGSSSSPAAPQDVVGTAIVMAAVVVEGASRLVQRRKRGNK